MNILLILGGLMLADGYDPNSRHSHNGVLDPIENAPRPVILSTSQRAQLEKGEVVLEQRQDDSGGGGVAVQYINATEEDVWATILNYDRYTDWVNNVVSCTVYERSGDDIYVEMISSVMGIKIGLYTKNTVRKDQNYMSWTLDYGKESDVNDMIGYWRVQQIQDSPPVTRVDYRTEMLVSGVPGFVGNYLTKDALVSGTQWVKKQAEAR